MINNIETKTMINNIETKTMINNIDTKTMINNIETKTMISNIETKTSNGEKVFGTTIDNYHNFKNYKKIFSKMQGRKFT